MSTDYSQIDEELRLDRERIIYLAPKLSAVLRSLRHLEELETFDLEPMTNAERWWLDADEE